MADKDNKKPAANQDQSKSLNKSKDALNSMLLENEKSPVSRAGNPSNSTPTSTGAGGGPVDEECTHKCGCPPEENPKVTECTQKCGCPPEAPPQPPTSPNKKGDPKGKGKNEKEAKKEKEGKKEKEPKKEKEGKKEKGEKKAKVEKPKPQKKDPQDKPPKKGGPIKPVESDELSTEETEPYRDPVYQYGRRHLENLMCSDELKKPPCLEQRYCADGPVNDWVDVKSNFMRHPERMQTIYQSSYTVETATPPEVDTQIFSRIRTWGLGPNFLYHYHDMSPSAPEPISTYQATFNDYDNEKTQLRPLNCKPRDYFNDLLLNYDCPVCVERKFSDYSTCGHGKTKFHSKPTWENEDYIFAQRKPPHPLYSPN